MGSPSWANSSSSRNGHSIYRSRLAGAATKRTILRVCPPVASTKPCSALPACRRRNTQPQVPGKGQFSGRRFRTVNLPWKSATARRGHICGARMIKQTCLAVQTGRQLNDSPDDQQQTRIGRFKFNERPFENSSLMRGKGHHGRTVRRQTWTSK